MLELEDQIDSSFITDSVADVTYKNGYSFGFGLRIATGFFVFFGALAIISGGVGYLLGGVIVPCGTYVLTSTYGTEISFSNHYIKNYTRSFGIKKGKWVPTVMLPYLTLLKMGKPITAQNFYGTQKIVVDNDIFEVYLLSKNHRKRILVSESKTSKEALAIAEFLSKKMEKELVAFNPVVSAKTRARRYERH